MGENSNQNEALSRRAALDGARRASFKRSRQYLKPVLALAASMPHTAHRTPATKRHPESSSRTALLYLPGAALIVFSWLQLEDPRRAGRVLLAAGLALVPALVRPRWARLVAALVIAALLLPAGLGLSTFHANGYTRMAGRFWGGVLDYYGVEVPFDPADHFRMHGVLVVAVLAFCLALALAIAARRPAFASLVVAAGAAW